jgi:hypothetical protein
MHNFSDLFDKVTDRSAVHHQEYLNTAYTQYVFVMLVLLTSPSVRFLTLADSRQNECRFLKNDFVSRLQFLFHIIFLFIIYWNFVFPFML